ncbi:PEP-CTERM sorting domain-containing protein [Bradyrhizobium sp. RDT10]
MFRKAKTLAIACAALLALSALPAQASIIDWTLANVFFSDGGSASGTFSTDSTTGDVVSFDITTTLGTKLAGTVYETAGAELYNNFWGPQSFLIKNRTTFYDLELAFVDPLTAPGVISLALQRASYECRNCSPARIVISGEAVAAVAAVPEPATWAMLLMGLLGIGAFRIRQNGGLGAAFRGRA